MAKKGFCCSCVCLSFEKRGLMPYEIEDLKWLQHYCVGLRSSTARLGSGYENSSSEVSTWESEDGTTNPALTYVNMSTVTAANVMKTGHLWEDLALQPLTCLGLTGLPHFAASCPCFLGLQTPWFVRYSHFWWMSCGDLYLLGNAQRFSKSGIYVWWLVFQRITGCLCAQTLTRGSRPQSFTCMFYFKIVI